MPEVIVIGAGVVGISTALAIQRRGYHVTVLDRAGVAAEASAGNAGALAFADIEPLATPGILRQAPKWLLDPLGPLSVSPGYAPRLAPWLWRFWRASRPARHRAGTAAQAVLMGLSRAAFERQVADVGGQGFLRPEGQLQLYEGARQFRASLPGWELRRTHGVVFRLLESPEEIAALQPGIHPRFTHAGFTPGWINFTDPKLWVEHLALRFTERGGRIERAKVASITPAARIMVEAGAPYAADHVVLAGGAWSRGLAASLGDSVPLETERGYNTTLPAGAFDLRMQLTFGGHGFVVTRIGDGLRVGGAVELAGLKYPPNYARADALLKKAKAFLPRLNTEGGARWMGFRPSMPDSLPVIGPARADARVIHAFGHGHLGLTQAAGTAEIVADLVSGRAPTIDLSPYRATRF
ncbi:FAD-dependent oxidoreductase [Aliiroseovarius sp.]|uniref:NAD(P)/FAD-dependent oxidoreductase n=1 Tax=Aliiroseovarius sp. TaxID=1872442 RepID=UPI002609A276|nr:FAD-dependent oxidoreductase [Aliiroseovarius sp.]